MSDQNFSHHHADGESEDEVNGLDLQRVPGAQDSETDSADSLEVDDLLRRLTMFPEALTPYEHTFLQSLQRDRNVCSLDKLITLCEFASSQYPDGHRLKGAYLTQLGIALEEKGSNDEAIGAYERALDGIVVDSDGLNLIRICFSRIGALLTGRYDRLGEAEDLDKAIWAQEMCIACTAADGELDELYGSLLESLGARWNLKDEEDLDRMLSYAEKAIALNPSNASAQRNLGLALRISYEHHHTLALIDRAILAMQSAVSYSMPRDCMEILTDLAESYYRRFHHVKDPSDASACIKYLDQAMECGKILSFSSQVMLIECLHLVFSWNDDVQCYERACLICETLLADDSLSNIERCRVLMPLGAILLRSYRHRALSPDPRQLEKCIQTLERAIECMSPERPEHSRLYYLLSQALWLRLQIGTSTVSEFEYAISIGRKAVELADDDDRAKCSQTLSQIFAAYRQAFPSRETQEQCVTVDSDVMPVYHPIPPTMLDEIHQAFWDREKSLSDIDHISSLYSHPVIDHLQKMLDTELMRDDQDYWRRRCKKWISVLVKEYDILPTAYFCSKARCESSTALWGGGFADIWKGRLGDMSVCLKVLRIFVNNGIAKEHARLIKDFCHEALVWRNLKHPNVLLFLGVSKKLFEPSFCFISPWMKNGDITSFLAENPAHDRLTSIQEVANGMVYLHSQNPPIVHADIRGGNILVTDDYRCCLADFGLSFAAETQALSSSRLMGGSARWSAPEVIQPQLFDPKYITARDVYAFGCTVIEIYSGKPPFPHIQNDITVTLEVINNKTKPEMGNLGRVGMIIDGCLTTRAQDRMTAAEVLRMLEELKHLPVYGAKL